LFIRIFDELQDYLTNYGEKDSRETNEHNDFVADFEQANFQERHKLEELQKVSLDFEKRLHERIIKNAEAKFEDPNGQQDIARHNR